MNNRKYIMVGAPIITREIFRNILRPLNNYGFKPEGGFWASEYISNIYNISDWFSYLNYEARSIAGYKNLNDSTIFTLKENTKILTIDTVEQILELATKYPSYHHILGYHREITNDRTIFDYEKLSQDYDGIYIDFNYFKNQFKTSVYDTIGANSLFLFNLDCIKEYQTAPIIFDIDDPESIPYIIEEEISSPDTIEDETHEHQILSKLSEEIFLEEISKYSNYSFSDYDEYLHIVTQNIKILISILEKEQNKNITEIIKYLQSKKMLTKKEQIIQNIALNYLSKYLTQDEERIKTLSKSKIKSPKSYPIH